MKQSYCSFFVSVKFSIVPQRVSIRSEAGFFRYNVGKLVGDSWDLWHEESFVGFVDVVAFDVYNSRPLSRIPFGDRIGFEASTDFDEYCLSHNLLFLYYVMLTE